MLSPLTSPNGAENAMRGTMRSLRDALRAPVRVPPSQVKAPAKKAAPGATQFEARLSVFFCVPDGGTAPETISIDFAELQTEVVAYYALDDQMDHGYQPVNETVPQALTETGKNVATISKDLAAYEISGNEGVGFLAVIGLPVATEEFDLTIRGADIQYGENPGARALFAANDVQIVMGQQTSPFSDDSDGITVDFTWTTPVRAALVACELEMDALNGLTDFSISGGGLDLYDWSNSGSAVKMLVLEGTNRRGGNPLICVVVVNKSGSAGEPTVTDSDDNAWYKAATVKF